MGQIIGGSFSGRAIDRNQHRKYLYIDDPDGEIRFSPKNIDRYLLKDDMSNKRSLVYIVRWKDGHKSLIRIPKEYSEDFVHGCEFGPLSKEEGRRNKVLKIWWTLVAIACIIFPLWVLFRGTSSSDDRSEVETPKITRNEYKWASWDGSAENMPSANVPIYVISATGDSRYGYGNIQGIARNRTRSRFNYIQITFSVYNSAGNKLGTCLTNLAGLDVGEDWQFNAYCPVWSSGGNYDIDNVVYY